MILVINSITSYAITKPEIRDDETYFHSPNAQKESEYKLSYL